MRRGTTPTITITVSNYDITSATNVWATFEQKASGTEITKTWERNPESEDANDGISVVDQTVTCKLSQEETLEFAKGNVDVQLKIKFDDNDDNTKYDTVVGTSPKRLKMEDILNEDVM